MKSPILLRLLFQTDQGLAEFVTELLLKTAPELADAKSAFLRSRESDAASRMNAPAILAQEPAASPDFEG
ncbi:MAG: hypothetical protein ACREE6_17710 [Limisphaerales bacterium]